MMSTMMLMLAPRAAVAAERINQVLATDSSVVPPTHPVTTLAQHAEVRFDDVTFS